MGNGLSIPFNSQSDISSSFQSLISNSSTTTKVSVHSPLQQFILIECPIVLQALQEADNEKLRSIVLQQFAQNFPRQKFYRLKDVANFLEQLRKRRLQRLERLTMDQFAHAPPTRYSCLSCRIGEFVSLAYFDTGCSVSCVTLTTARRLGLDGRIDSQVRGVAVGFGSNRRILGCLQAVPVQVATRLTLCVDFVVIGHSSADFLLLGADLMQRVGLFIDYAIGEIRFPRQEIPLHSLRFVPNEPLQRSRHLQQFKLQLLSGLDPTELPGSIHRTNQNIEFEKKSEWPEARNGNMYVHVRINKQRLLALVDTGADSSKISESLAEQLNLLQLVDESRKRLSHGLGSVLSVGRIPPLPVRFEGDRVLFVPFEVLREKQLHLLLLGSDFLTQYNCRVDFGHHCIEIPLLNQSQPLRCELIHQAPDH